MPSCLHLLNSYLPLTETFIWQYLSQAREFRPVILAEKIENLDLFPLPAAVFPACRPTRSRLAALGAKLLGRYAQGDYAACLPDIRALNPDLVHVHNGYRACVSLDFTARLGLPTAVNFYGSDVTRKEFLRRARHGYARLFGQARAFLVEGPAMRMKLAALGCPENRIHLQRIAIDPSDYPFRARTWDGNRPVRFIFVGRLVEKKGLEWGLRALAASGAAYPWELTIVGDGPLRPSLEGLIRRLGLERRARILGYLSLSAMRAQMREHDIQFQPSRTSPDGDGEGGAPTVLLEAQACGMPVVSTLHDDIPYVTVPGGSAWLVPEGDVAAMASVLRGIADQAGAWPEMGRIGRKHVEERHDARREVLSLERIYRDTAGA